MSVCVREGRGLEELYDQKKFMHVSCLPKFSYRIYHAMCFLPHAPRTISHVRKFPAQFLTLERFLPNLAPKIPTSRVSHQKFPAQFHPLHVPCPISHAPKFVNFPVPCVSHLKLPAACSRPPDFSRSKFLRPKFSCRMFSTEFSRPKFPHPISRARKFPTKFLATYICLPLISPIASSSLDFSRLKVLAQILLSDISRHVLPVIFPHNFPRRCSTSYFLRPKFYRPTDFSCPKFFRRMFPDQKVSA